MKGFSLRLLISLLAFAGPSGGVSEETNTSRGYGELMQLQPVDEKGYFDRGIADVKRMDWSKAISDFSEVIRLNSTNALAYECRGCAQVASGNYDAAIADLSQALKIEPKSSSAHFNRAGVYRQTKEFHRAIQDLNVCVQLNPTDGRAYKSRAACHSEAHDYKDAIKDWDEGLRIGPDDATALACRGGDYFQDSQFDNALADIYKAIRMDPTNCLAYDWLAWLRATCPVDSMRNGKEAVEAATKACELTKWKHADWIDTLAAAYAETGDFEKALKYERQAIAGEGSSASDRKEYQHRLSLYEQRKPDHNGQKE